jgi:hypothetical protein
MGETMAETRTRLDPTALDLSVDIKYDDVWTDPVAAGRPVDASFSYLYADLTTPAPVSAGCQTTCTACHGTLDAMDNLQVPAAQLDLTDGPSSDEPDQFKSYRELLFSDNEQEIVMGALQDRLVQATDGNGNPLFEVDANGNLILDAMNNPIPVLVTVNVSPVMSVAGARASSGFFSRFDTGASHEGMLDPAELKLISEWLDIGAQYFNNPFDAPPP